MSELLFDEEKDGPRFWAKVNKTGTCWLWTGSTMRNGYGNIKVGGRMLAAHRISYKLHFGVDPGALDVDHICHVRLCVNPSHLRAVTRKQNLENMAKIPRTTTGIRGVCWDKLRGKWKAQLKHNGKRINVGRYDSIEEAAAAAKAKRNELFTHNDADRIPA
jgi:hypothetical protein